VKIYAIKSEPKEVTLGSGVLGPSCSELDVVGPLRFPSRCHKEQKNQTF